MIPEAAGLINLHLLHSVSQPCLQYLQVSPINPVPHFLPLSQRCLQSAPVPPSFPKSLSIPLLHPLFLKTLPIAMSHVFCLAPCSSVPLPPSPCPPSIYILAFCSANPEHGYLCWLESCADQAVHTTCDCPASCCQVNKESLLSPCLFLRERNNTAIFSPLPMSHFH